MKLSVAVAFAPLFSASAFQIKQVSFNDPLSVSNTTTDTVDARDAKIHEGGQDGSECFVYTSEANDGLPNLSFKDWKIWETCGVFGDGPLTNELLQGDTSGSGREYTFSDTSGDGSQVCFNDDIAGSGGISIHLLSRPASSPSSVTEITDSEATEKTRDSIKCDLSRDGSAIVFESDDNTLVPGELSVNQEHVFYSDDEGQSFHRLVPDEYYNGAECSMGSYNPKCESKWGVLSGDGSMAAFHSNIRYKDGAIEASPTAWETYLWRKSDKAIHKVTDFKGKECNRTASFEMLVNMYGLENLEAEGLVDETKLGSGGAQCESFALAGMSQGKGAGTIDVKDNAASISDDGRYVSFRGSFESATMKGTHEPYVPVSKRNVFLYDAKLGITWGITDEGVVADVEAYCCPTASSSKQRGACSVKNEMRQDCCWQRPCYNPSVSSRISGNGEFIVLSTDMAPGDTTQINYDWEIVHYHIPSGKTTQITNTDDKNHDEFFPSISRKGDVVAFTSSFDYTQNVQIPDAQIFAAKIETGCSRDSTASNYQPRPDVEVCCEWDSVPEASDVKYKVAKFSFHGDPTEMKSRVAFFDAAGGDAEWCAAYAEQVRTDVACSLAIPQQYVAVKDDLDCSSWQKDEIEVALILKVNPLFSMEHTCSRLEMQYETMDSNLWKSYLTKTMKLDSKPSCSNKSGKKARAPKAKRRN